MTKQDYLLAVIDAMPDREMGRGIKAMIENNQLEDHALNVLILIFKKAVDRMTDIVKKEKLQKTIEALEAQKEAQAQQDKVDLEKLDTILNAF